MKVLFGLYLSLNTFACFKRGLCCFLFYLNWLSILMRHEQICKLILFAQYCQHYSHKCVYHVFSKANQSANQGHSYRHLLAWLKCLCWLCLHWCTIWWGIKSSNQVDACCDLVRVTQLISYSYYDTPSSYSWFIMITHFIFRVKQDSIIWNKWQTEAFKVPASIYFATNEMLLS